MEIKWPKRKRADYKRKPQATSADSARVAARAPSLVIAKPWPGP